MYHVVMKALFLYGIFEKSLTCIEKISLIPFKIKNNFEKRVVIKIL